jgi:hypothetical protein
VSETTPAIRQAAATDWVTYFDDLAKGELSGRIVRFDKERLDDFVGTFRHAGFGTLHIEPRGEYLWFRIDGLSGFDGPLVRYSGLSFEYQGDRDAMAWPVIAVAKATRGECARVRFGLVTMKSKDLIGLIGLIGSARLPDQIALR